MGKLGVSQLYRLWLFLYSNLHTDMSDRDYLHPVSEQLEASDSMVLIEMNKNTQR